MSQTRLPETTTGLRFGYTFHDLQKIAEYAAYDCRWAGSIPWAERVETALSALAERLYAAEEPPSDKELRNTAWNALSTRVRRELRHHGFDHANGGLRQGFARYWNGARLSGSPEDAIVDRLALAQIWAKLHPTLRAALQALADCDDDYGRAADKLGITRAVLATRVSRARAAFLSWWHEHEEPSRLYSRHQRRADGPTGHRRPATRSLTERARHRQKKQAQGKGQHLPYNRARRTNLPIGDEELARRHEQEHVTLTRLAAEYGTSHSTIRRRITAARTARNRNR